MVGLVAKSHWRSHQRISANHDRLSCYDPTDGSGTWRPASRAVTLDLAFSLPLGALITPGGARPTARGGR